MKRIVIVTTLVFSLYLLMDFSAYAASIVEGTEGANPTVIGNSYYDHSVVNDQQASPLPAYGKAMYYSKGLMEKVWNYRFTKEKYPKCDECVGFIALIRNGDRKRKVCIQRKNGDVEGPFYVIDVVGDNHKSSVIQKDWVVDVDYATAYRWGMIQRRNIDWVTVIDCPQGFVKNPSNVFASTVVSNDDSSSSSTSSISRPQVTKPATQKPEAPKSTTVPDVKSAVIKNEKYIPSFANTSLLPVKFYYSKVYINVRDEPSISSKLMYMFKPGLIVYTLDDSGWAKTLDNNYFQIPKYSNEF